MTNTDVQNMIKLPYFEFIMKGFVAGILSGYLLIYGMRPAVPYPEIILEVFEHKWLFIIMFIINYYVFVWDYNCGALMLLCILALIFDYIVFTDKGLKKVKSVVSTSDGKQIEDEPVFVKKLPSVPDTTQTTFEDTIIKDMTGIQGILEKEYIPGQPAPFLPI